MPRRGGAGGLITASRAGETGYQWVPEEARQEWVRRNRTAFDQLQVALSIVPELPVEWPCESLHARFLDAVVGLMDGTSAAADVASLGAAVIRRNMALGMSTASLVVPEPPSWPTADEWQASGALVHPLQGGMMRVWADYWEPSWSQAALNGPPVARRAAGQTCTCYPVHRRAPLTAGSRYREQVR